MRCTLRRWLPTMLLVAFAAPAQATSALGEHWLRVQEALASENQDDIEDRILELQQVGDDLALRRLTPYAMALVLWAKDRPGPIGESVVRRARVLDSELPSSYFLVARWQWQRRAWIEAARSYLLGWWAVFCHEPSRWALVAAVGHWALAVLGWTLGVAIVMQILQHSRRMVHDAMEISRLLFRQPNAVVLAVVVLLLPLFLGQGPIWVVVYLFVLSWAYMDLAQRITGFVSLAVLALLVPIASFWQQRTAHPPSVIERLEVVLRERRLDPSAVREFAGLEEQLDSSSIYHLVAGELVRMHGDPDAARIQFQKAALKDGSDPIPLVFLGNLSMEEGDIARAIQSYGAAVGLDARCAVAYHNLSLAYDQSRRFQEGDAARATARELMGRSGEPLGIRGRDARIRYPWLGKPELRRLRAETASEVVLGGDRPELVATVLRGLLAPTSRVFWIAALLGLVILGARRAWLWTAQTCVKCGKVFCPKCKTATESASYCSQCISVFLKRDMVSIDQQAVKADHIRRWLVWSTTWRRVAGFLVPGSHLLVGGSVWLGVAMGFLAWGLLTGALVSVVGTLPSVEPLAAVLPVQIVAGVLFLAVWLRSISGAWYRR